MVLVLTFKPTKVQFLFADCLIPLPSWQFHPALVDVVRFQQFQTEGIKHLQSKDYAKALKSFAAATNEHADSWQTLLNIGICQLRLGDYKATITEVQKSIKLGGLQPGQCTTMSGAYEELGDPQKARAWLDLGCKIEPTKADHPAVQAKMVGRMEGFMKSQF